MSGADNDAVSGADNNAVSGARPTILAFGATGPIAGLAVPALRERGARVRALIRREDQRPGVLERGAAEAVLGDLADADSIARALVGVDAVFFIAPAGLADEAAIGTRVVAQAAQAGVRRFVLSSVIHPVLDLPNHARKAPVEAALVNSGMRFAILHPAVFYQNLAPAWPRILETGVVAEPWSVATRHARVDYRDVAAVAAIALLEDRLVDGTFELCAEGALDRSDIAALLGDILGRPIRAERIDPASLGPDVEPLRPMFEHYDRHGIPGNASTLRAILGREPRSMRAFFAELAGGGTPPPR